MKRIDLRSDTVSHPTTLMRTSMVTAEVGDDFYGEDPTVNQLQERVACLLGKERGLFLPSGTMSNLVAIAAHTQPGQEVICDQDSHVFNSGGAARWTGVQLHALQGQHGILSAKQVEAAIRTDNFHGLQTGLILLENPHNRGGGTIYPLDELERIGKVARRYKIPMHLDGARLLNAVIASAITAQQLSAPFDSVYFCLSKGLGCPVGSVLAGSADFITHATRLRLAFGGGMCQVGMLAAAGLWALDHHVERLTEDHRRAQELATQLAQLNTFAIELECVQTNIVFLDVIPDHLNAPAIAAELEAHGVAVSVFGPRRLRLVTHLDIDDETIKDTINVFTALYE